MTHFFARFPQSKESLAEPVAADYREAAHIYNRRGLYNKARQFASTARRLEWAPKRQMQEAA